MSTTSINRTLNLAALGMIFLAVGVGAWSWFSGEKEELLPSDLLRTTPSVRLPATASKVDPGPRGLGDELIASDIWSRPLRDGFRKKSSHRSEPVKPPVAVFQTPAPQKPIVVRTDLGLRLVGTVLEDGNSMAIAVDRQGKLDFRKEGESFELIPAGVRVETVLVDSIRVSYQGQDSTWRLGESLALNSSDNSKTDSQAADELATPGTSLPIVQPREMTLEEELDFINGDQPDNSF